MKKITINDHIIIVCSGNFYINRISVSKELIFQNNNEAVTISTFERMMNTIVFYNTENKTYAIFKENYSEITWQEADSKLRQNIARLLLNN